MLTTNLSTRPFYNERAVRSVLGLLLLLAALLTAYSAYSAYSLRSRERSLGARATQALAEADRLRGETRAITAQINPKELETVTAAANEANAVIAQRAFSWTALLGELEATVPDDVRITSVEPRLEKGTTMVTLNVEAMSPEHLAAFIEALEKRGAFRQVLPREEAVAEDKVIDAKIEATYDPGAVKGSRPAPATHDGGRGE
jgi:Tfp pilus assembly protein PilN